MVSLSSQTHIGQATCDVPSTLENSAADSGRKWYAVFTLSQNERSAARHLEACDIESFVPTYESVRVWKNRQRVTIVQALFPTYLFVRMRPAEQSAVLQTPGVRRIVGNLRGPIPLPGAEIEFLRSRVAAESIEPHTDLVVGERVRIKCGPMRGLEGVLMRRKNSLRFVLTIELINQHAAVEVAADDLEQISA
jgi:transcription antitermination factor NusG